jgi:hypothetical protein
MPVITGNGPTSALPRPPSARDRDRARARAAWREQCACDRDRMRMRACEEQGARVSLSCAAFSLPSLFASVASSGLACNCIGFAMENVSDDVRTTCPAGAPRVYTRQPCALRLVCAFQANVYVWRPTGRGPVLFRDHAYARGLMRPHETCTAIASEPEVARAWADCSVELHMDPWRMRRVATEEIFAALGPVYHDWLAPLKWLERVPHGAACRLHTRAHAYVRVRVHVRAHAYVRTVHVYTMNAFEPRPWKRSSATTGSVRLTSGCIHS